MSPLFCRITEGYPFDLEASQPPPYFSSVILGNLVAVDSTGERIFTFRGKSHEIVGVSTESFWLLDNIWEMKIKDFISCSFRAEGSHW